MTSPEPSSPPCSRRRSLTRQTLAAADRTSLDPTKMLCVLEAFVRAWRWVGSTVLHRRVALSLFRQDPRLCRRNGSMAREDTMRLPVTCHRMPCRSPLGVHPRGSAERYDMSPGGTSDGTAHCGIMREDPLTWLLFDHLRSIYGVYRLLTQVAPRTET